MKPEHKKKPSLLRGVIIGVAAGLTIIAALVLTGVVRSAPAGQATPIRVLEVRGCEVTARVIACGLSESEFPQGLTPAYAELVSPISSEGEGLDLYIEVMSSARWDGERFLLDCEGDVCTSIPVTERQEQDWTICFVGRRTEGVRLECPNLDHAYTTA